MSIKAVLTDGFETYKETTFINQEALNQANNKVNEETNGLKFWMPVLKSNE